MIITYIKEYILIKEDDYKNINLSNYNLSQDQKALNLGFNYHIKNKFDPLIY